MNSNSSVNQKYEYEESDIITPDFSGRRGTKTTISDLSIKKRVLLVCVYNIKGTLITHDVIYKLFMKYGEIYKILIFDKCKNWKIFVEMATLEQAEKALNGLNNYQIFDDGSKMTVYYAKVDQIVFQNNNSGGVDYRELKMRKNIQNTNFQTNQTISSSSMLNSTGLLNSPHSMAHQGDMPIKKQSLGGSSQRKSIYNNQTDDLNSIEKQRNNSYDMGEVIRNFESLPNTRVSPNRGSVSSVPKKNSIFQNIQPVQSQNGEIPLNQQLEGSEQNPLKDGNSQNQLNDGNGHNSTDDFSQSDLDENNNINQINSDFQRLNVNNNYENSDQGSVGKQNSSPQSEKDVENVNIISGPLNQKSSHDQKSGNNTSVPSSNNFNNENLSNYNIFLNENLGNQIQQNNQEVGSFESANNNPENQTSYNTQPQNAQFGGQDEFNKLYKFIYEDEEQEDDYDDNQYRRNTKSKEIKRNSQNSGNEQVVGNEPNGQQDGQFIDPSNYVNPLYILENKKSRVIYVRGIEKRNLTTKKIYNLFSNFGNIELILYFTEKRYCLIQFETQDDATVAKDHLDSLKIESNQMRIFYSNYETIKENQEGEKQCETWKGEKNTYRFRYGKLISINPITNTLHVSNLKQETCKQEIIFEKFSPYGVIEAFHPIIIANKYMCHVKFQTIEEAINALSNLHEEEILGRKMHISFTRSKISPTTTPETQNVSNTNNNQSHNQYNSYRNSNNFSHQNNMNYQNTSSPQMHPFNGSYANQQINISSKNNMHSKYNKKNDTNQEVDQSIKVIMDDDDIPYNQDIKNQNMPIQQQYWGQYQSYPYYNQNHMPFQQYVGVPQYGMPNNQVPYPPPGQQIPQTNQQQISYPNGYYQKFPANTVNNQQNTNFTLFK